MIPVTKTFLPPQEEFQELISRIWKNQWLTNNGELYKEFRKKLQSFLNVDFVIPTTNGTLPLQIALNAFGNCGEVITTPFSYVATTSSIVWEKCTPVFVDIHKDYLTIDETKIEAAITPKTTAILATHVYGNACNLEVLEKIAKKHSLKLIYDAAHCFGVTYKGNSIFNYGDVSTCSFHATKLFHSGEGGALFCKNKEIEKELWFRHNFGHNGPEKFHGLGINAKMSELQAAMGLSVLPYVNFIIEERKKVCDFYDVSLNFNVLRRQKIREGLKWNYAYYPIIFKNESTLIEVKQKMEENNIFARRYFFPSLEKLPYIKTSLCPIAEHISTSVLCLPVYVGLQENDLVQITSIINSCLNNYGA
ncbi:DegT/DnrJ/EryC1/StrS family aminotransferase [Tamlana sp. 62-3]|uniref:DegT/DnrJ/EryC1/StrS family aminotransferase n=1 Tax=Neotamlana sargassicola TaxID=2883125 RepID=A0A9X1I6H4_9FLAO|nr:DegT/DnrJ/EryC1/StrS family aminotransferase [Tamlana sargassicola]MCB4808740.1 DegT/DnrJ/EryC1/StrS family aminotransferase [Tamlana sargassicola]